MRALTMEIQVEFRRREMRSIEATNKQLLGT